MIIRAFIRTNPHPILTSERLVTTAQSREPEALDGVNEPFSKQGFLISLRRAEPRIAIALLRS
jgi:hypothetical protein